MQSVLVLDAFKRLCDAIGLKSSLISGSVILTCLLEPLAYRTSSWSKLAVGVQC